MQCDQCGEREAIVHLNQQVGGEWVKVHLCERCAAQKGLETASSVAKTPLGSFLAAMGKPQASLRGEAGEQCPRCGATLQDFRDTGRLGCTECYRVFEGSLRELLRRLHGSTQHVGERYAVRVRIEAPAAVPAPPSPETLREQLRVAVETENFELAAELRDKLRMVE
ncbi:MAG: UvrB/UvrC motif-containing protein [Gemmatimonadota bacterium]